MGQNFEDDQPDSGECDGGCPDGYGDCRILANYLQGHFFLLLPWTEELSRYLMIWITLLGASVAFQYSAHIGVEILVNKLSRNLRNIVQVVASLCCLALFVILIVKGIEIVEKSMVQKSPAMTLPMGYAYLIMPISGVLMTLNLLDVTIKSVRAKEDKKE